QLVLKHRAALPASCVMPFTDLQTLMRLSHKGELVRLAARVGVKCPDTRFFENASELDPASVTDYPAVLKPCLSRIDLGTKWLNTAVRIVHNRQELTSALGSRPEFRSHPFMLQSFIPGTGAGVFALYDRGREVATFAHRRLREKPPAGGVSVLSESAEPVPAALASARKLLGAVDWHGVAMVEMRVAHDGTPYLMEVNTRLWGSLQLAIDAGVDFPWLLYQVANNQEPVVPGRYRVGRRLRWWLGDLDSLYLFLRDSRYRLPTKLRRLMQFLTPDPFRTRHEVFRWQDPLPAWREFRNWIAALRS
ncbi:MAG: ATP-grasp domain-containing protein, partial [Gammaproteobacteria bacterium]